MFQKELGSLESFRKLLTDSLFNHPRPCKTDQCFRFSQDNISQHGKACRHASRCRICQYGNIEKACIAVALQCSRCLSHLHKGCDPLLHSGSAGTGEQDHRQLFFCRSFYCSCNLFSHCLSHACHEKTTVTYADHSVGPLNLRFSCHNCFPKICFLLDCLHFFRISLIIHRISADQVFVPLLECSRISDHFNPSVGMDAKISSALRTNIISPFYIFGNNSASAFITFSKQSFRHFGAFFPQ